MSSQIYLVSFAAASADLFRTEVSESSDAEIVESLDEGRALLRCAPEFRSLFVLHRFPVQVEGQPGDLDEGSVRPFVWDEGLPREELGQHTYAIQITSNERLEWSFSTLVENLRHDLGLPPDRFRPRDPEVVLSLHLHQAQGYSRLFAGISPVAENLSPWAAGQCRIPRDPDAVSRAEAKLLEAWEAFGLQDPIAGARALDLGAAPGGWTRLLAGKGYQVEAVDPASLDPQVAELPGVRHHEETAGSFLKRDQHRFHLLVSDMKMEARMAARLLVHCAPRLAAGRGYLLATLKLSKGPAALEEARRAVQKLGRAYDVIEARQLFFNRSEITVYARARARAQNAL